ncbi:MAG: cupin domain-containing protein [Saprospiraceae bacterium]|nr:cupin domain-containing protein [Saprospiraceae bacterium]
MKISIEEAVNRLHTNEGSTFVQLLRHGSMSVEIYEPREADLQQPHLQDEIYVIISGTGRFQNGTDLHSFQPGDLIFVPAGVEHRFLDFSPDFKTWVIFYGAAGGESNE